VNQTSPFGGLLGSETRARLLVHFVVNPRSRLSLRALGRRAGVPGKRSLQIEVDRLVALGLLRVEREARATIVSRSADPPQWSAVTSLAREFAPLLVLRDVLAGVPGVEAAFVFGSFARGDARPDSDIDLFVYGEIPDLELGAAVLDASLILDRELDVKRYSESAFRRDVQPGASFLPSALRGPKLWLVGSAERLPAHDRIAA
jgi:predicted nucleotidyltransferase